MAIKIGLTESDLQAGTLMYTIPSDSEIDAQIVVDIEHIVSGTFCHMKKGDEELVWAYAGDQDPAHSLDIRPRFSVIVPSVVKEGDKKVVRYIRGPKQFLKQLLSLERRFDTIKGLRVKFIREDKDWVRYTISPTGKRAATDEFDQDEILQDFMDNVFQGTPSEIMDWLGDAGPKIDLSEFKTEEI